MDRVTVYHLTRPRFLPRIEEEGLLTRASLSHGLGPPGPEDEAAPGRFAHGKRVSAFLSLEHARTRTGELGPGLVSFTVDPAKVVGVPGSARGGDAAGYWAARRPLGEWLEATPPEDLEVHQPVAVRAKHLRLHAPLFTGEDLGDFTPLVEAVADQDRLSAKALMHLCLVACDGDFSSPAFHAACALAWRDEPDPDALVAELRQIGPDNVASAALAEFGSADPEVTLRLRRTLDDIRAWGQEQGLPSGEAVLARSGLTLEGLSAGESQAGD